MLHETTVGAWRTADDGSCMSPGPAHDDTRVLLADRVGPGRAALATLVSHIPRVTLVGEIGDGQELAATMLATRPDVVVVDDRLLPSAPDSGARMIVVGADDDPGFADRARRRGAIAWIPKDRADSLLPLMLRDAAPLR